MIYTVITNIEKMDCRVLRQSEAFISQNIIAYIENTTNPTQKKARYCAYSSLFFALGEIFGEKNADISFSKDGKPYLINSKKQICISISHCEKLCAVCLSDEGEVGVDVQDEIDRERAKRLEKRFFTDIEIKSKAQIENEIFIFELNDGKFTLAKRSEKHFSFIEPKGDFTERWSIGESLLKCDGIGLGGTSDVNKIQKDCNSHTIRLLVENKVFALSISVKRL